MNTALHDHTWVCWPTIFLDTAVGLPHGTGVELSAIVQVIMTRESLLTVLERKFMSCSYCQELGQPAVPASDWLFTCVTGTLF